MDYVCTTCGYVGKSKSYTPGSILIEIILWLFLIVPGLIYSIWRLTNRKAVCKSCGSTLIVPVESPNGQRIIKDQKAQV